MVGNRRQGWALYAAMVAMLVAGIGVAYGAEQHGTPAEHAAGIETAAAAGTSGGNLQGKEQRFGIADRRRVGDERPPPPPTARSTPATTPTPAPAARC